MKLNDLLEDLEKAAGFPFEKSDDKKEDEKESKKEDSKDDKKEDKKEDKDEDMKQEKSAAFKLGADLAKEIMEKVASTKIEQTDKGEDMNKQASEAGKALAQALLKQAGVGDQSTSNGIPAGVVPNKTQVDIAQQVAEHDAVIQSTPGTDGLGNGGTINQIFDAIVADAVAKGVKDEKVTGHTAQAEGAPVARQAPAQVQMVGPQGLSGESQEKTAAVVALVNSGVDFDDAVNLVKAASDELEAEHQTQVKQAALNELLSQGVDFDRAVSMVKQAHESKSQVNVGQEKKAALDALLEHGVDFDQAVDLVNEKAKQLYGA